VDYAKFQIAVVELADEGTPLTTAKVAARLRIEADEAERHLRRMAREERLEIDEEASAEGARAYRVRGLSPRRKGAGAGGALRSLRDAAAQTLLEKKLGSMFGLGEQGPGVPLPPDKQRKISVGALVGGVVPGLGLAYSAPWKIVAISTVAVVVGFKVLAFISLMLAVPFLVVAALASAALGGLYTWQYNQMGRRAALGEDPSIRKLQSKLRR
jgi:hypothetical protein